MKGCEALLLLLLCLSGTEAQGHNGLLNERHTHDQPGDLLQPDLWGELKELRDMVVEMRAETRLSLRNLEEEVKEQKDLVADLRLELGITKHEVEGLAKANAG